MKKLIPSTLAVLTIFAFPNVSGAANGDIPIAPFQIVQSIAQAIQSAEGPVYKSKPVKTSASKKKRTASRSSPTPSPAAIPSPTPSAEDIADQNEWVQTRERLLAQIGGAEVPTHSVFQLGSYSYQIDGGFSTTGLGSEFARLQSPEGALYVVVKFRIRNDGNETAATDADDFKLVDADRREFSPDSRAMVSVSPDFLLRQLHPGIWKKGIVVFEVPKEIIYRGVAIVIPEKGFGPGRDIVFARWTKKPEHQKSRQKIASHSTIVPHENQEAKRDGGITLATTTASNQSSAAVSTPAEPSQAGTPIASPQPSIGKGVSEPAAAAALSTSAAPSESPLANVNRSPTAEQTSPATGTTDSPAVADAKKDALPLAEKAEAQGEQRVSDVRIIPGTRWVAKIVTDPDGFSFCMMSVQEANGEKVSFTVGDLGTLALIIEDQYLENQISSVLPPLKEPPHKYGLRPSEGQSYRAMLFLDDKNFNVSAIRISEHGLLVPLGSVDTKALLPSKRISLEVGSIAMRGYDVEGLGIAIPELQDCARQLPKTKQGQVASSDFAPHDNWQPTGDEAILTLPNGQRFVSQIAEGQVTLTFPTGQTFVSESAKGDLTPPLLVSTDGTLVVVERHPATQSGDIHIYIKETNGSFKEVPNVNEQIDKLLKGVKGAWGGGVLWMKSLSDHTLTLWSVALNRGRTTGKYQFRVEVGPDGSLLVVE